MEIEQVLHQRWSDSAALEGLMPSRRVTTGRSVLDSLPRASLGRRSRRIVCRTNSGDCIDEFVLEMCLHHERFDEGAAIVAAFIRVFDRTRFPLGGGAKVLQIRSAEETCRQDDRGVWQFQVVLTARVHRPAEANAT